ncbi:hypothetical protein [Pseudomonas sp. 8AS]|uniref:hypothetical protein n=1 Tax=Pseudomonas sp. 8AS TaxID=2653163 RepID=UPI0013585981|nr:hypothetical protein [Pseudomonas sp. 8AS]
MADAQQIVNRFSQLGGVFGWLCRITLIGVAIEQFFYVIIHWAISCRYAMVETKTMPTA